MIDFGFQAGYKDLESMISKSKKGIKGILRISHIFFFQTNDYPVTLAVGGDVSFSGIICYLAKKGYCKYNDSFTLLQPVTNEIDFVLVNLESPIGNTEISPKKLDEGKEVHLMAEEKSLDALK